MTLTVTCPQCNTEFALREARNDDAWRELVELLASLPQAVQQPLLAYLDLFKPARQTRLRSSTALKMVRELQPLIKAQQVSRHQKSYDVDVPTWANALAYLAHDTPTTIKLPLKGNGYLLSILVSRAEKIEAKAEAVAIRQTANSGRDGKMQGVAELAPGALQSGGEKSAVKKDSAAKTKTLSEVAAMFSGDDNPSPGAPDSP
jgi:hypothetical protein